MFRKILTGMIKDFFGRAKPEYIIVKGERLEKIKTARV